MGLDLKEYEQRIRKAVLERDNNALIIQKEYDYVIFHRILEKVAFELNMQVWCHGNVICLYDSTGNLISAF